MSRSGYTDCEEDWLALGRWRGMVASATRGKRGQAFFREMLEALDALPEKFLQAGVIVKDGECCAMGAVAIKRGMNVTWLEEEDSEAVGDAFGIAPCLAAEIAFMNDECYAHVEDGFERFKRMRAWIVSQVKEGA